MAGTAFFHMYRRKLVNEVTEIVFVTIKQKQTQRHNNFSSVTNDTELTVIQIQPHPNYSPNICNAYYFQTQRQCF